MKQQKKAPSKHGGKRAGAGRKPKTVAQASNPAISQAALFEVEQLSKASGCRASEFVPDAYKALKDVINGKEYPAAARVTAARAIIDLAMVEQGVSDGVVGKKGQRAAAAKTANAGIFATPRAPRLVVDNH